MQSLEKVLVFKRMTSRQRVRTSRCLFCCNTKGKKKKKPLKDLAKRRTIVIAAITAIAT